MRQFRFQALHGLRQARSSLLQRPNLACAGCQSFRAPVVRWSSSNSVSTDKPYYITTPIFYVNAAPHIGHLYTMIMGDVLKRWQEIKGKKAFLCTGTDEHGMKIQRAAAAEKMAPKAFCDMNSQKFRDLAAVGTISHDFFIRTTDEEHKGAVEQFWLHLKNTPPEDMGLYKGTHEGWYSVSDECFYAEDEVQPAVVPQTGRKIMASIESGNEVEWIKEDTWFFPLSKYKDRLLRFYDENPDWIKPRSRMNEVRSWVENHLQDLSITRPASRLDWGIRDPEDSSNTIYVWVDALINYATKAGFSTKWQLDSKDKGLWPADVQVIGKDIIRFHAVYWPAMLMAVGLPLPKKLLCHNHWTMSDRKMSKSLGNVVNPFYAIERFEVDAIRYFLMRNGSLNKDTSYSNDLIMTVYDKELRNMIGNTYGRIARAKGRTWSLRHCVEYVRRGIDSSIIESDPRAGYLGLEEALKVSPGIFQQMMDDMDVAGAIREAVRLLGEINRFLSEVEPWTVVKENTLQSQMLVNWTIYKAGDALRVAGILLQPIMPTRMKEMLDNLGVKPERRSMEWAVAGKDMEFGLDPPVKNSSFQASRAEISWEGRLFPPIVGMDDFGKAMKERKAARIAEDIKKEEARRNDPKAEPKKMDYYSLLLGDQTSKRRQKGGSESRNVEGKGSRKRN